MKDFGKKVLNGLQKAGLRFIYAIDDFLSLKVQIMVVWMVFVYLSNFQLHVVITAAIVTLLVGWGREIQKPDSNLYNLIKTYLENRR